MRCVSSTFKIPPSQLLWFPLPLRLRTPPVELVEFLWVLVCRCVFFPTFEKLAMKYLPLAKTLALGQSYALGTLLLASVYQAMCK